MTDSISAIATAPGKGGVAIVRISGKEALSIAKKMFAPTATVSAFTPYRMYPGQIDAGTFFDYGLMVYFRAPMSYTGEDVVEFHCHGGETIARGILKKTFSLGARSATKGEFTKRAFLNGKLSLASAEGIADMINGESEAEVKAGYLLYGEKLTQKVKRLQGELTELLAGVDASIDYPEEDVEEQHVEELKEHLHRLLREIEVLKAGYGTGKKIKSGVTVALCGKPNTGKSSLLNRLLGYDKAIVSSRAGTTRDVVEGSIEIEGVKFNLYDTAGVREADDEIEKIGIERATSLTKSADVAVFIADDETDFEKGDETVLALVANKPTIKVLNKTDLRGDLVSNVADVCTSAVTGEGIEKLKALLYEKSLGERTEDVAFLIEERHYDALRRAYDSIQRAIDACAVAPLDLIGIDMKCAWDELGEITGETANETIISEIFAKFCVGK